VRAIVVLSKENHRYTQVYAYEQQQKSTTGPEWCRLHVTFPPSLIDKYEQRSIILTSNGEMAGSCGSKYWLHPSSWHCCGGLSCVEPVSLLQGNDALRSFLLGKLHKYSMTPKLVPTQYRHICCRACIRHLLTDPAFRFVTNSSILALVL
jgi:hypothetical protein